MNWQAILDPATSARLSLTLLHSVWEVAFFAAVAWPLCRARRRSVETAYTIHVAALLLSLAALPITYLLIPAASRAHVATSLAVPDPSLVARLPGPPPHQATAGPTTRVSNDPDRGVAEGPTSASATEAIPSTQAAPLDWPRLAAWINTAYFCGVLAMLARLCMGMWRAHRWCAAARPIEHTVLVRKLNLLARQWSLRVVPALLSAEQAIIPKVVGVVRPVIVFPAAALAALTPDDLEMILIHELAHVKRYDMWVNLLQRLAEAALFFNPALWFLSRRISTLREYCCDELTCKALDCPQRKELDSPPPPCGEGLGEGVFL
jgi:Zn-dependent protease with chaperone function